jgi:hypothetical protein
MPTPFMHMALAERLIHDPDLPDDVCNILKAAWGAFLLGSIAPDARVSSGIDRAGTHFFEYAPVISPRPIAAMLTQFPQIARSAIIDAAQVAFVAGYIAHLTMDEVWCTELLFPTFINGLQWPNRETSFLVLHILLSYMDQRDLGLLPPTHYPAMASTAPRNWLPFMTDEGITVWRDTVASQLAPEGGSRTNEILGQRIHWTPEQMKEAINDPHKMAELVWHFVPEDRLAEVEQAMYSATRDAVIAYVKG